MTTSTETAATEADMILLRQWQENCERLKEEVQRAVETIAHLREARKKDAEAFESVRQASNIVRDRAKAAEELVERYRVALADAIRRPMGVIPDSAIGLTSPQELDAAEQRRPRYGSEKEPPPRIETAVAWRSKSWEGQIGHDLTDAGQTAVEWQRAGRTVEALYTALPDSFEAYFARQIAWSRKTFGPGHRTKGVIQHIRKELAEIEANPFDLAEWIDVMILAMDGFWRHGGTAEDALPMLMGKQEKNMARTWPDWRTMSEDNAIEHDRSGEAPAPAPEPSKREPDAWAYRRRRIRDGEWLPWGEWKLCGAEVAVNMAGTIEARHGFVEVRPMVIGAPLTEPEPGVVELPLPGPFAPGQRVEKHVGEARYRGIIVADYRTTRGGRRFVVEVEPQGFQMIVSEAQIRPL